MCTQYEIHITEKLFLGEMFPFALRGEWARIDAEPTVLAYGG